MSKDTVGSMVVAVSATSQQFGQDMDKIGAKVNQTAGTIQSSFKSGLGIGAGIAAIQGGIHLATEAFNRFFAVIQRNAALEDFAQEVGATASEISGLHYAAGQLDSSAEAVDAGLEKMIAKIGEARGGSEEAAFAFKALNLDLDKLAGESAAEAFKDIADAMSHVTEQTDRAAIARDVFGKGSVKLLNILSQTKGAINDQEEAGRRLGRVLTNEQAAAMDVAEKSVTRFKASWEGLENTFTTRVLPVLNFVIEKLTWLLDHGSAAIEKLVVGADEYARQHRISTPGGSPLSVPESHAATSMADSPFETQKKLAKEAEEATKAAQKAQEDMVRKGASLMDQLLTPQEKFNQAQADAAKLLEVGAINWDFYQRAVAKAADELDRASESKSRFDKLETTPGVGAAIAGTSEAFSAVQSAIRGQQDARNREKELQAKSLEEQKKTNAVLRLIQDNTKGRTVIRGSDL